MTYAAISETRELELWTCYQGMLGSLESWVMAEMIRYLTYVPPEASDTARDQ